MSPQEKAEKYLSKILNDLITQTALKRISWRKTYGPEGVAYSLMPSTEGVAFKITEDLIFSIYTQEREIAAWCVYGKCGPVNDKMIHMLYIEIIVQQMPTALLTQVP